MLDKSVIDAEFWCNGEKIGFISAIATTAVGNRTTRVMIDTRKKKVLRK